MVPGLLSSAVSFTSGFENIQEKNSHTTKNLRFPRCDPIADSLGALLVIHFSVKLLALEQ